MMPDHPVCDTPRFNMLREINNIIGYEFTFNLRCEDCRVSFDGRRVVPVDVIIDIYEHIKATRNTDRAYDILWEYYKLKFPKNMRYCKKCIGVHERAPLKE